MNVPDLENIRFYGNTVDIPYFASGPVEIKSRVKEWDDYTTGIHENATNTSDVANSSEGNYIHISNVLNYDFTSTNYDVSPYKYTIVLKLKSDNSGLYDKTLVVTQYPPLYITNTDTSNDDDSKSNMYVNGYYTNSGSERAWDSVGPTTTGTIGSSHYSHYLGSVNSNSDAMDGTSNVNPNIYSVTTTILKFTPLVDGAEFQTVLGDPRAAATNEYSGILTGTISGDDLVNTVLRPTIPRMSSPQSSFRHPLMEKHTRFPTRGQESDARPIRNTDTRPAAGAFPHRRRYCSFRNSTRTARFQHFSIQVQLTVIGLQDNCFTSRVLAERIVF